MNGEIERARCSIGHDKRAREGKVLDMVAIYILASVGNVYLLRKCSFGDLF